MVGALADWFAVTALFRHPLGLPDPPHRDHPGQQGPHRPQPRRVRAQSFLDPDLLAQRVRDARRRPPCRGLAGRAGQRPPGRRDRGHVPRRRAATCSTTTRRRPPSQHAIVARVQATPAAPLLATALELALARGAPPRRWSTACSRAPASTSTSTAPCCASGSPPSRRGGCPSRSTTASSRRSSAARSGSSPTCRPTPQHELRLGVDHRLLALVDRLRTDPELAARVEARKERAAGPPRPCRRGRRRCGAS